MKRAINLSVLVSLIFMMLLALLPYALPLGGAIYVTLYALCFAVPVIMAHAAERTDGAAQYKLRLLPTKSKAVLFLPTVLPVIASIMGIAWVTNYLLSLAGLYNTVNIGTNAVYISLVYVIIPAVGEELLFRLVPIKLIAPYSKRAATLVSALLFSAVHANVFQIPYALFAGIAFALADIAAQSIVPSLTMHLLNNALSVLFVTWVNEVFFASVLISAAVLILISIAFIIAKRKTYKREISEIISHGGGVFTTELAVFLIFALIVSVISALSFGG